MQEKEEYTSTKINIICMVIGLLFIAFCTYLLVAAVEDFQNDYRCAQMSDEQFFNNKMCEKYWDYRRSQ